MKTFYRQGDVMLIRLPDRAFTTPAKAREAGRVVLAYGEATGHAHAIEDALAELFEEKDGRIYLRVGESGATVRHEEHAPIGLARGTYEVRIQREYSPEAIRNVAD